VRDTIKGHDELKYQLLKERYFDTNSSELLDRLKDKLYRYYRFAREMIRITSTFLGSLNSLIFQSLKYLSLKGA